LVGERTGWLYERMFCGSEVVREWKNGIYIRGICTARGDAVIRQRVAGEGKGKL